MGRENAENSWRVRLALGAEAIEDAAYLLPPVTPPPAPVLPDGPHPPTEFIVDIAGAARAEAVAAEIVRAECAAQKRAGMGLLHLWAARRGRENQWRALDEFPDDAPITALALTWELTALFTTGGAAAAELAGYILRAVALAQSVGWSATPRESPADAAARAARLIALKIQFARSVEMRILPAGRAFSDRAVWRTLYALGLEWGAGDLFHWFGGAEIPLFTVSGLGHPTIFLPERAAEGEGAAGLSLAFELPLSPAPLEIYDRMSVALSYLRQKLNGRPLTPDGSELDADRLHDDREALFDAVQEMSRAGIAPGSPDARRLFL